MTVGSPPGIDVEDIDLEQSVVPVAHELDTVSPPPPLALVVFGASGDLAARKLLPAIAGLADHGALADGFTVVGVARTNWTDEDFRQVALAGRRQAEPGVEGTGQAVPLRRRRVRPPRHLRPAEDGPGRGRREARALPATASTIWPPSPTLRHRGHRPRPSTAVPRPGRRRLVRPPAWWRSPSAATWPAPWPSNATLHDAFDEYQIFRIDHYMGKETVQNVLALRFANAIFEPIWNRRYVDHIQITVAEQLGVEHRGGFYETAGALRDIVQNHVMQVLALTLMEPPASHRRPGHPRREGQAAPGRRHPDADEAVDKSVRAQYTAGTIDGEPVVGYREEEDVDPRQPDRDLRGHAARASTTGGGPASPSTSAPASGCRSGSTEVTLQFQRVPHLAFGSSALPRSPARTPSSCGSSPTRGSACGSGPRSPARPSGSGRSAWTSPTPRPSQARPPTATSASSTTP